MQTNIFLQYDSYASDESYFPFERRKSTQQLITFNEEVQTLSSYGLNGNNLMTFYLRSSHYYNKLGRQYGTLIDMVSYLGGLWKGFAILGFIIYRYNKYMQTWKVVNQVFQFPELDRLHS